MQAEESIYYVDQLFEKLSFPNKGIITINPERNSLKKAKFSTDGLAGLLTTYGIIVTEN